MSSRSAWHHPRCGQNDRLALQWDVCQEVLAWEGYYEPGPVDTRTETLAVLTEIGEGAPAGVGLGYHLCHGSPADEHLVQPKHAGLMVEMINAVSARVRRPIHYLTQLYFRLIHYDDAAGDITRLAAARRYARVDSIATECGMARGDPARLPALLVAHATVGELIS